MGKGGVAGGRSFPLMGPELPVLTKSGSPTHTPQPPPCVLLWLPQLTWGEENKVVWDTIPSLAWWLAVALGGWVCLPLSSVMETKPRGGLASKPQGSLGCPTSPTDAPGTLPGKHRLFHLCAERRLGPACQRCLGSTSEPSAFTGSCGEPRPHGGPGESPEESSENSQRKCLTIQS